VLLHRKRSPVPPSWFEAKGLSVADASMRRRDMSVFADARHLASWAGLCPGNPESGGKRMSGRIRKANCYVKRALCQAAWAPSHTRNTVLSAFYRRMQVRKGAHKAIIALAHHMITVIYNVLARGGRLTVLGGMGATSISILRRVIWFAGFATRSTPQRSDRQNE